MPARVVVVGSANTDIVNYVPHLPRPGETVTDGRLALAAGGKGANQAVAAARLGAEVTFIARLGHDAYGDAALSGYLDEGLDTRYLTRDPEAASGVALILVEAGGENQIAVAPGANHTLLPEHIDAAAEAFAGAGAVLLQLESPMDTVIAAARHGRAAGAKVILNPAPMPADGLPAELLATVDVITPNEIEAAALGAAGRGDGPQVVMTRGAQGAVWAGDPAIAVPAPRVKAVDAVGAGDAFNGALAVALAEGLAPAEALRWACAAGALAATREGAQPSLPSRAQVAALVEAGW